MCSLLMLCLRKLCSQQTVHEAALFHLGSLILSLNLFADVEIHD